MSVIRNIHISFTGKEEEPSQPAAATLPGYYTVSIQSDEWGITGKYCHNSLCALDVKRTSQDEAEE